MAGVPSFQASKKQQDKAANISRNSDSVQNHTVAYAPWLWHGRGYLGQSQRTLPFKPAVQNFFLPLLAVRVIHRQRAYDTVGSAVLLFAVAYSIVTVSPSPSAVANQSLLVNVKCIATCPPAWESPQWLQTLKLWLTLNQCFANSCKSPALQV